MQDDLAITDSWNSDDTAYEFAPEPATGALRHNAEPGVQSALASDQLNAGRITLNSDLLRQLRQSRLLSQQDLADDCWRRNIRISIATIKRAETGCAVRFRIARELARCFEVPVMQLVCADTMASQRAA
jgi:DNA-binding XRE family transcriptional regulator